MEPCPSEWVALTKTDTKYVSTHGSTQTEHRVTCVYCQRSVAQSHKKQLNAYSVVASQVISDRIQVKKAKNRKRVNRRRLSQKSLPPVYDNLVNQASEVAFCDQNLEPQPVMAYVS